MPNREILASPDIAESEEGAVLLNSGYTALGKVMAGSGGIQFTKAELDSGDLPEGTVVEDLTAPIEYAGDAMIAKCENTGTGEATVVVQATSVGVETGFYVKGVMLYIKDPEGEGDVAYSYLPLQSKPEWMRQPGKQDGDFQHHQHCGRSGERFGHHRPGRPGPRGGPGKVCAPGPQP